MKVTNYYSFTCFFILLIFFMAILKSKGFKWEIKESKQTKIFHKTAKNEMQYFKP